MSYKNLFIFCVVGVLVFCGCGLNETVTQKEKVSYLNFTGDTVGAVVRIDDLAPIVLNNEEKNVHYEISSGKHHIIVIKNGAQVVNRKILLGSGSSKEIRIP
ncbi:hypothetical protein [uncultured Desulfobacter sp.]|uniref:hypothetical protein n=1 Tax=uncultured Desulfobacter sp. TaxID=240139 RepID=UPI0029F53FE5|nr:hypothetical protein [uncultured Desulfobacter sp.]